MHEDEKRVLNDNIVQKMLKKQAYENMAVVVVLFIGAVLCTIISCWVISDFDNGIGLRFAILIFPITAYIQFAVFCYVSVWEFIIIKNHKYNIICATLDDISRFMEIKFTFFELVSKRYNMLRLVPFSKQYNQRYEIYTLKFENFGEFYVPEGEAKYHSNGDEMFLVVFEYRKKPYIANVFNKKYYHLDNNVKG